MRGRRQVWPICGDGLDLEIRHTVQGAPGGGPAGRVGWDRQGPLHGAAARLPAPRAHGGGPERESKTERERGRGRKSEGEREGRGPRAQARARCGSCCGAR